MHPLVKLLGDAVEPKPKPAVFISGGLDSTILLHELTKKTDEQIYTYTVGLPEDNEFEYARKVADHYDTIHREIVATEILREFECLIPKLPRPSFNLWVLYAYRKAFLDDRENVYLGEGLDEHFGGYENKPPATPQELWAGVIEWSLPTHRKIASIYNITLHTPFIRLPLETTIRYWRDPHVHGVAKMELKKAYREIIPDFVLDRRKVAGRFNWEIPAVWDREMRPALRVEAPATHEEANRLINRWATRIWLVQHND